MPPDKILALVPCYNCAAQVGRVLRQFDDVVAAYVSEVLVLDNGSRDCTVEAAIQGLAGCKVGNKAVALNRANYNLGGSHKAAFAYARSHGFTHVLVMHGDDQGRVADILPLLRAGTHRDVDACLGSRFSTGSSTQGYSRFRIFGNRVFNLLFTLACARSVQDLGSGLNIFGGAVIEDPAVTRYADDLRFNIFLLLGFMDGRRRFTFFPISWREDDQVSNVKLVSQTLRTLTILSDYVLRRRYFRNADHRSFAHETYTFDVIERVGPNHPMVGVR